MLSDLFVSPPCPPPLFNKECIKGQYKYRASQKTKLHIIVNNKVCKVCELNTKLNRPLKERKYYFVWFWYCHLFCVSVFLSVCWQPKGHSLRHRMQFYLHVGTKEEHKKHYFVLVPPRSFLLRLFKKHFFTFFESLKQTIEICCLTNQPSFWRKASLGARVSINSNDFLTFRFVNQFRAAFQIFPIFNSWKLKQVTLHKLISRNLIFGMLRLLCVT